jgi:Ion channel
VKRAAGVLAAVAGLGSGAAWLLSATWHLSYGHALYCALGTATTVGCDAAPHDTAGRAAASVVMLTLIPSLAAVFAWLTGRHAAGHMREHLAATERRITEEADRRHVIMQQHVERLLKGHCADLRQHISVVAGGGAGSLASERAAALARAAGHVTPPAPATPPLPREPGGM